MTNACKPKGLLLDAMGTLIGLRHSVGSTYAAFAAEHGITVDAAAINSAFGDQFAAAPPLAFPGLEGEALQEAEQQWWFDVIAACLRQCGHSEPLPPALGPALFQHYAGPSPWTVYSDVAEHLRRWRSQGLKLAVVSNFDQRLAPLLEHLELADLLDAVVVSSQVGAAKPSPLPFQRALEALELKASEAWHIGDSPEDEAGAHAAGVHCVLIRRAAAAAQTSSTPGQSA